MFNNKTALVGIALLAAGLILGYSVGTNRPAAVVIDGHVMTDGRAMVDDSMEHMMESMNAALRGKTGDDFDRAFLGEMIVHHEGAVEMANAAFVSAKHQEIKDLARAIIAAQVKEIDQMKLWLKNWYGM